MNEPLVSVVIPTYNRATVIGRTIDDIFSQSYQKIELIVVDDGSTDDTQSILRKYQGRIRVIVQDNAGPAVARNRGAQVARGAVIAFQDSDDLWEPSKLERQVALLANYGTAVPCCICNARMGVVDDREVTSFGDSQIFPRHKEGLWLNVPEVLATRFVLFNQTVAIRREAFERAGGFREDLKYLEDYDLPLRLSLEGPWAYIRDPLVLYNNEVSAENFSQQALRELVVLRECAVEIFESVLARVGEGDAHARFRRLLRQRLVTLRWLLTAARLRQTGSLAPQLASQALIGLEHYLRAAFRRSPWFPRPLTTPVEISVDDDVALLQGA